MRCTLLLAIVLVANGFGSAQAQVLYQAPYGAGGTWNLYEQGETEMQWWEALETAQGETRMGVSGDLASIQSIEENDAVLFVGGGQNVWIGLTDREGAAPQLEQHGAMSPQESYGLNPDGGPLNRKLQGWAWTSGEPFDFHNWNGGEPSGGDGNAEDVAHIWPGGDWNDAGSGYFEEEPEEAVLQELTSLDESGGPSFPFVIEYRTKAATPFADIPIYEPEAPPPPPVNAISEGIDTFLAEGDNAQKGPDGTHGDLREWEWDGSDGGGQNQGLLWFDIPQAVLDRFGNGTATLRLQVSNEGDSAEVYRVTSDWLSGPDGGDNVTWNNVPNGPGLFPGDNVDEDFSIITEALTVGEWEFDVTDDVEAWRDGEPNYGWGFLPTGGGGTGIRSFESNNGPLLVLELEGGFATPGDYNADGAVDVADIDLQSAAMKDPNPDLGTFDENGDGEVNFDDRLIWVKTHRKTRVGDANLDGEFSSGDLVSVFAAGKYETGDMASWAEGDWDGDMTFGSGDLVAAFSDGGYEQGPLAARAVPEPTSICLLSVALVLSVIGRRRALR